MNIIPRSAHSALHAGIILLCLQYSITFEQPDTFDDSSKVVIEFKRLYDNPDQLVLNPHKDLPRGYSVMYREQEVHASEPLQGYFVSHNSDIRGLKSDIDHTFVGRQGGNWTLHIVFKEDFGKRLGSALGHNKEEGIAVVIKSDLLAVPASAYSLTFKNDGEEQHELVITTNVKNLNEAEELLDKYNM